MAFNFKSPAFNYNPNARPASNPTQWGISGGGGPSSSFNATLSGNQSVAQFKVTAQNGPNSMSLGVAARQGQPNTGFGASFRAGF